MWGLNASYLSNRISQSRPSASIGDESDSYVAVGRAQLRIIERQAADEWNNNHDRPAVAEKIRNFAPTGVCLRLLERIAVCVQLSEPVLLVGETGAGKTANIQHLASLCGRRLLVHNMHVQSDSTELLGVTNLLSFRRSPSRSMLDSVLSFVQRFHEIKMTTFEGSTKEL